MYANFVHGLGAGDDWSEGREVKRGSSQSPDSRISMQTTLRHIDTYIRLLQLHFRVSTAPRFSLHMPAIYQCSSISQRYKCILCSTRRRAAVRVVGKARGRIGVIWQDEFIIRRATSILWLRMPNATRQYGHPCTLPAFFPLLPCLLYLYIRHALLSSAYHTSSQPPQDGCGLILLPLFILVSTNILPPPARYLRAAPACSCW